MISGIVEVEPIWRSLGIEKAEALPIFHAFAGADNIGKFSGFSKTQWFQQYMKADISLPIALLKLPGDGDITEKVKEELAKLISLKYCPSSIWLLQGHGWPDTACHYKSSSCATGHH